MFTLYEVWYGPVDGDGPIEVKVGDTREFKCASDVVRFVKGVGRRHREHWTAWSLECEIMSGWRFQDRRDWEKISRVYNRWQRFTTYMLQEYGWQDIPDSKVFWMDNSVTIQQQNKFTGEKRQRYLKYPHGDLC